MLRNGPPDQRYIVLHISKGLRFGCLKNVSLRISAVLQNQRLTSKDIVATPEPNFNVNFIWCTTAKHIDLLQKWCSNIEIAICATSGGKTWTAGYAVIGIQHAQVLVPDVGVSLQHFPLYDAKTETQMVHQSQLLVTLSIRSRPPRNINSQLYSANLTESSEPIDRTATTKTKKEERQERLNRLAQPRNPVPKVKDRDSDPTYHWSPVNERLTIDMQRPRKIRPPLPPHTTLESLSSIRLRRDQKIPKFIRELQQAKDYNIRSIQTLCSSTESQPEVMKSHDYTSTLPNNKKIPSRIRLIVQNVDTSETSLDVASNSSTSKTVSQSVSSLDCIPTLPHNMRVPSRICLIVQNNDRTKMESLGMYGSSSTFKMIGQSVHSLDRTPTLPNNMRIPSRIRWILQNIDPNKIPSLGARGSSSTFQMIGQPPPTRKPELQIPESHDHIPAPQKDMATEAEEEDNKIPKSLDQTPSPSPCASSAQTISSKLHVKAKKSVRFNDSASIKFEEDTASVKFEEDTASGKFEEDTDMKQR